MWGDLHACGVTCMLLGYVMLVGSEGARWGWGACMHVEGTYMCVM